MEICPALHVRTVPPLLHLGLLGRSQPSTGNKVLGKAAGLARWGQERAAESPRRQHSSQLRCSPAARAHPSISAGRARRCDQQGPRGLSTTSQPSSPPPRSLPSSSSLGIRADAEVQQRSGKNIFLVTAKPVLALTHQQQKKISFRQILYL